MRAHVEDYVRNCHECQRLKPRYEFIAPLGEVMEPTRPWELLAMDICGPFPITANKNRCLLTFIDHLTKYMEAVPLMKMTAEECARASVTNVIARHGASARFLSDKGRNFTSTFFREVCKILGFKQLFMTAWHPASNGQCERWHRSLREGLSHYVNTCGNNWDTLVPLYLMAYSNTPHGTTKHTPYYMLHGREMILPSMQSLRAKFLTDIRDSEHEPRLENLKSRLRTAYKIAREQGRRSHATNKRYYDKHAKHREFEVGDTVYLYNPAVKKGVSSKFRRPCVGPWRVTEKKSRLNYAIVDRSGKRLVVHVNRPQKAYSPVDWERANKRQPSRTNRPKRRPTEEEADYEMLLTGPIEIRCPLVETLPLSGEHQAEVRVWTPLHQTFHLQRHPVTIGVTQRTLHPTLLFHVEKWK